MSLILLQLDLKHFAQHPSTTNPRAHDEEVHALVTFFGQAEAFKSTSSKALSLAGVSLHQSFTNILELSTSNKSKFFHDSGIVKLEGLCILEKDAKKVSGMRKDVLERRILETLASLSVLNEELSKQLEYVLNALLRPDDVVYHIIPSCVLTIFLPM